MRFNKCRTLRPPKLGAAAAALFPGAKWGHSSGMTFFQSQWKSFLSNPCYLSLPPSFCLTPPPPALPLAAALWWLSANGTGSSSQLSTPISKHSPTSTPNSPGMSNKQKVLDGETTALAFANGLGVLCVTRFIFLGVFAANDQSVSSGREKKSPKSFFFSSFAGSVPALISGRWRLSGWIHVNTPPSLRCRRPPTAPPPRRPSTLRRPIVSVKP